MIWKFKGRQISFEQPRIMGVVNVTPDSFSDGGQFILPEPAVEKALALVEDGADILDLGGESTRPGAQEVSPEEELARLLPVLKRLRSQTSVPISIDTTKTEVARACLDAGADIINDVSGLEFSGGRMAETVRRYDAGLVIMHRRGTPETMQAFTRYHDLVQEVVSELEVSIDKALSCGLSLEHVVIDPGLGFSKTAEQSFEILARIEEFFKWQRPVLVGASRKSFLGKVTGRRAEERDAATAAVSAYAAMKKIHIVRVHNVKATRDAFAVIQSIQGAEYVRS